MTADPDIEAFGVLNVPVGFECRWATIRTVRQPLASTENWWEFLQRSRAELQAAGSTFMTEEDVQSHVEDLRSGDERLDTVYRRMEDEPRTVRDDDRVIDTA